MTYNGYTLAGIVYIESLVINLNTAKKSRNFEGPCTLKKKAIRSTYAHDDGLSLKERSIPCNNSAVTFHGNYFISPSPS